MRHDCFIPDKRLYILLHVIRDRWQDAWYLACSIHFPLLMVKNKRQNIGDLTFKSMNIQHSLFIQSYRHGVYRCTDVLGPHFRVSAFPPIRGWFHILPFPSSFCPFLSQRTKPHANADAHGKSKSRSLGLTDADGQTE